MFDDQVMPGFAQALLYVEYCRYLLLTLRSPDYEHEQSG